MLDHKNMETNKQQGDKVDMITMDVPLFIRMLEYAKEDAKTDMDLHSATERALKLTKTKGNLSMECYDTIVGGSKKQETTEMEASDAGAFEAPMSFLKRDLYKPKQDVNEVTGVDGSYDVSFSSGRKDPLAIGGEKTIGARESTIKKTKSFPMLGGPGAKFVTINPKCKKFPYCNQGDPKAIKISEDKELNESIKNISKKYGIPLKEVEKMVINEIKQIFI